MERKVNNQVNKWTKVLRYLSFFTSVSATELSRPGLRASSTSWPSLPQYLSQYLITKGSSRLLNKKPSGELPLSGVDMTFHSLLKYSLWLNFLSFPLCFSFLFFVLNNVSSIPNRPWTQFTAKADLKFWSFSLCHLRSGGLCDHTQLTWCWGSNPERWA